MSILYLDLETYSEVPIAHGTHAYAAGAQIMLWAYAIDDGDVKVWDLTEGGLMPEDLHAAWHDKTVKLVAHNYQFERTVLEARGLHTDLRRWRCTMALAYAHSLPGSLESLCVLHGLGEEQGKLADGRRLVHLFCVPRPKNMKLRRATRQTHPQDWELFKDYCGRDVVAMRALMRKMVRWNWTEEEVSRFHVDGVINERGVQIDTALAHAAIKTIDAEQKRLGEVTVELTDGALASTTQRDSLLRYLADEHGFVLEDLRGSTIEKFLERLDLDTTVRELLLTRLQASTASTAKYKAVARAVSADGRLRGALQFRGAARTGRYAGRTFQPQNLPRPPRHLSKTDIAEGIRAIKAGVVDMVTDNVMEMCSAALRGLIIAAPGHKLVVADLANIEGRMVAWLADEEWKLEAFRDFDTIVGHDATGKPQRAGPDLYRLAYARAFHLDASEVNDDQRQIGKVMELALAYGGAVGAFTTMGAGYGVELPETEVVELVRGWRAAHPHITKLWYGLDEAVKTVTRNPTRERAVGRLFVDAHRRGRDIWVRVRLPSGRYLSYPQAAIVDDEWTYMGTNQFTRKWERIRSYGAKCVENATQAAAADVLLEGIQNAECAGYRVVLSVHDEIVSEPPDESRYSAQGLALEMTRTPIWAAGLPLAAEGYETKRYRK